MMMGSPSSSSPLPYTNAKRYMYDAARWACFRRAKRRNTTANCSYSRSRTTHHHRPPLAAILLLLLSVVSSALTTTLVSAAVIDMPPPQDKTCFGPADLFEIGKTEIFVILGVPIPGVQGVTLDDTRRYELCTQTTYPFGLEDANSGPFFTYDGNTETRLRPMSLVNPNIEIHCGPPPGVSSRDCIFGGPNSGVAINTPADRQTIVDYVNLLGPTINPALVNIGNSIPAAWVPDVTNLVVRGITFRGSEAINYQCRNGNGNGNGNGPITNSQCIYGPVRLYAFGQNQRIVDCKFEDSGLMRAQYGGIVLSYNQAWHGLGDGSLPYQELTVEDTVFQNNKFQQGAIVARMAIAANAGNPPDGIGRKGFKIQIINSKFQSNTIQGPHVLALWEATGRVESSCFVDNVVDQTVVSDVFAGSASAEGQFVFSAQSPSNTCGACTQGVYSAGGFRGNSTDYCPGLCECNVEVSTKRRTIKAKPVVIQDESTDQCLRVQGKTGLGMGPCSAKNTFSASKRGQIKRKGRRAFCMTTYLKNGVTPAVKMSRCKGKRKKSASAQLWKHGSNGIIQMKKPFRGVKYCLSTTGGGGLTLVKCSDGDAVPWKAGLPITAAPSS